MVAPAWIAGAGVLPAQPLRAIAPLAGSPQAGRDLLAALAGRSVAALVIGRAEDGHGIVEIEGHQLTIAAELPEPGSRVILKFGAAQGSPLLATPVLARAAAPALPMADLAANDGSALVELGEGARSLGRFAATPLQPLQLGQVAAEIEKPAEWAAALSTLLRDSGTFYESHLAAWTRGNYPLEQIRGEPQAEKARAALPAAHAPGGAALPGEPIEADAVRIHVQAGTPATLPVQAQGVPESLQPVIREQLHALETHALPFSVAAWPGQRADMVISRDQQEDSNPRAGFPATGGWKTSLKLQLPQLGSIVATLTLQGDRLWLDLSAPAGSAALLDQSGAALDNAMLAAGIRLVRSRTHQEVDHAAE
ncbi:MAG: hypothetical protein JWN73_984 [Betaproteobacteria bacterium]|nr:hypothetical protein [Betaproteobacteria bacterium]